MNFPRWVMALAGLWPFIIGTVHASQTSGVLKRVNQTSTDFLNNLGTIASSDLQTIINKYGQYGALDPAKDADKIASAITEGQNNGTFDMIMQERAALLEAFFVQLGLEMDTSVVPGIDISRVSSFNTGPILQAGLKPIGVGELAPAGSSSTGTDQTASAKPSVTPTAAQSAETLPQFCGSMFNISRYIRGIGGSLGSSIKTQSSSAVDTFYGAVVVNVGWNGSQTQQPHFNESNGDKESNGIYWIKAGIQATSFDKDMTYIPAQTAGIPPVSAGVDTWTGDNGNRVISFVFSDADGSGAFSSTDKPAYVQVGPGSAPNTPVITLYNTNVANPNTPNPQTITITDPMKNFFTSSLNLPWAVLLVASNPKSGNANTLEPVLQMVGLVRLNPSQFPLHYQAEGASFVKQPFTGQILTSGMTAFEQQLMTVSPYTGDAVSQKISFGTCNQLSLSVTASTSDTSGLYLQPANTAIAKYNGAMNYKWGAQYSMHNALKGNVNIINSLFMTDDHLSASDLINQINGQKKVDGQTVAVQAHPSILII